MKADEQKRNTTTTTYADNGNKCKWKNAEKSGEHFGIEKNKTQKTN